MLNLRLYDLFRKVSLWGLFTLLAIQVFAQPGKDPENRLEILKTDLFEFASFGEDSVRIRKLLGNVHLRQDTTDMYCDSAYQYIDSNYVVAYSNVKIVMGGGKRTIDADRLTYDGETKILNMFNNIVMQDSNITLTTDRLTYYRNEDYGKYFTGGKIVSEENVLTSQTGYYYPKEDMSQFRGDVKLDNPDYSLRTDTLGYNTESKVAFFLAPTQVVNDSLNTMYTEDGYYDTANDFAFLNKNAQVGDADYTLFADTITFDQANDIGKAIGSIKVIQQDSGLTVFGKYGEFYSKTEETFITDSSFAVQTFETDTLYLFADTLASIKDTATGKKYFRAFDDATFFMRDFQGRCDSLSYWFDDSLIYFYQAPVLWSEESQLTGDTIMIGMHDGEIDTMSIPLNSFIISEEDTIGYNQIKGKSMQAKFLKNKLHKMWLNGSSESIYFTKDDEENYLGMNKATCADMYITFENNKPSKILFKQNPEGTFSPMHMVLFKQNRLEGFLWRAADRPVYPEWAFPLVWPEAVGADSLRMELDSVRMNLDSIEVLLTDLFPQPDTGEVDDDGQSDIDDELEIEDEIAADSLQAGTDSLEIDSLTAEAMYADSIRRDSVEKVLQTVADSLGITLDSLLKDSAYAAQLAPPGKGLIKRTGDGKPFKAKKKCSLKKWWENVRNPDPEVKKRRRADRIAKKGARYMEKLRKKQAKQARKRGEIPPDLPEESLSE